MRKSAVAGAVLALTAMLFAAPSAGAAPLADAGSAGAHVLPLDPVAIDDINALEQLYGPPSPQLAPDPTADARCGPAAPDPVPDGEPIVVTMPPAPAFTVGRIPATAWRDPPVADPSWRLQFQGLMWMKSLARRAAIDGQLQSLGALVDQAVTFHRQNPDPGNNNYGWDEGTALRRLETENCLYALSAAESLRTGMTADAKVLLGPRYYGPPNYSVHNHGLMANLQLVRAGEQLGVPSWKSTAVKRMTSEAPQAFSSQGITYEQSSAYQGGNAVLWGNAVTVLQSTPGSEDAAASIGKIVATARVAYEWMTELDGVIVQIGDSDEITGAAPTLSTPRVLRDDQTGWVIGRWSWTDPNAVYYTVRTGPPRRAHGQHDRGGGVTFSVAGVRVLVGPGRFSYDAANNYNAYQMSPNSHNVALPDGGSVTSAGGKVTGSVVQGPAHAWTTQDTMFGITHNRNINVNRDTKTMKITDTYPSKSLWRQYFHLDPQWTKVSAPVNGTKLVFAHPSGRRLTITTTGRMSSAVQGITRPPQGWHFPKWNNRVWAYEIVIRSYGQSSVTSLQVS
ncbi:hypothetical protein GCM10020358_61750 [Amorphoplanes nipponensis]|uniref:Heparinase II/III-like C-terminal domain-containing protein n=1 Tax=Actinoplanes nipponensis TaxID=135950 RepID=A0A919JQL5_9ACTN|nr:heparinase II/III family protein [Actinoplanes nipponensis]GIE53978.1 hypothetical protein Ani05nite_75120 [Actinoplanes nipponensis]